MPQVIPEVAKGRAKVSSTSDEVAGNAKDKSDKVFTISKNGAGKAKDKSEIVSNQEVKAYTNSKDRSKKMSSKSMSSEISRKMSREMDRIQNYREVRKMVERRNTHGATDFAEKRGLPKSSNEFVYVNSGYTDSEVNIAVQSRIEAAPTCVVREQYWACSRWPSTQRALAMAVGVLLGAVIGLAVTVAIRGTDDIAGFFRKATPG